MPFCFLALGAQDEKVAFSTSSFMKPLLYFLVEASLPWEQRSLGQERPKVVKMEQQFCS